MGGSSAAQFTVMRYLLSRTRQLLMAVADLISLCSDRVCNWLFIAVFLGLVAPAVARQDDLSRSGGVSPDGKFTLSVEQADTPHGPIHYVVRERHRGIVVGRFKSSYQPEEEDDSDFAWDQSHPSWIYWRPDSQFVAIDEANHNRMGTVILAQRLRHSFHQIPLSEEELMAYTKQPWDRGRPFFGDNCFLPHDRARIDIIGLVRRHGRDEIIEFGCSVILDLGQNGKIIKVVLPKATKPPNDAKRTSAAPQPRSLL
jgi:hypothetical protein